MSSAAQPTTSDDDHRPELEPLDVDGVSAVATGTVIWAVLFVAGLALNSRLQSAGCGWWVWVALSGFLLGLAGLVFVVRRRNAYRSAGGSASG